MRNRWLIDLNAESAARCRTSDLRFRTNTLSVRKIALNLILVIAIAGCESTRTVKIDNPVMPQAPPRMGVTGKPKTPADFAYVNPPLNPTVEGVEPGEEIDLADFSPKTLPDFSPKKFAAAKQDLAKHHQVVAKVNGEPIFASEMLERYSAGLERAKKEAPPAEFEKLRRDLIKRDLPNRIQRKVMAQLMKSTLKSEQLEPFEQHLDQQFQVEVNRLMKELKVHTRIEVQDTLRKQGTSLASLRDEFLAQRMATEYMGSKMQIKEKVTRPDLVAYYQEHLDDYALPSRVKWQQIKFNHRSNGGEDGAKRKLNDAVDELRGGASFADVAKKFSNGPKAREGGQWPWTQRGSLADSGLEKAIFTQPIKEPRIVFSEKAIQIVQVLEREDAGRTPFEDVQADIEKTLLQQIQKKASDRALNGLFETAVIETIFDDDPKFVKALKR